MNEIDIKITKTDRSNLDEVGKQGQRAGREIADGLEKGFREGEQASQRASRTIKDNLADAGEQGGGLLETGIGKAQAGMLGLGGLLGGLLIRGFGDSMQERKLGGLLAAQTGATSAEAGKLGETAGDVFASNFGDSVEAAADGVRAVLQNKLLDTSATEADLARMTELVMTAGEVVGEEANEIARAAQQMVRNGLAGSAEEALDIITRATQEGLNVSGDLLDTVTEYSTKFRDLGLSGQESFGLISQAADAGARDTDTAADALKEFSIRAIDGSAASARGFRAVGLSAQDMAASIASGGGSAREALRQTLNGLQAIEDPVLRNQAAVDLFGTKAEDLGDALFAMDLDTVAEQFGDVAGATQRAADQTAESTSALEKTWRGLQGAASDAGGAISDALDWLTTDDLSRAADAEKERIRGLAQEQAEFEARSEAARTAWQRESGAIKINTQTLADNIATRKESVSGMLDLSEAQIRSEEAIDAASAALAENGRTLDIHTEKGRANQGALNEVISTTYATAEAMEQQGSTSQEVAAFIGRQRDEYIRLAERMGMSGEEARRMADKLRLIPGDYIARVGVDAVHANNTITTIRNRLIDLTNRSWVASVAVTGAGRLGGGRYFAGLEHGGVVGAEAPVLSRAEGGPGHSRIVQNEGGPELAIHPDGTMIVPAGMSRQIMAGAFGGGSSGPTQVVFRSDGSRVGEFLVEVLRQAVHDRGGSLTVLGI